MVAVQLPLRRLRIDLVIWQFPTCEDISGLKAVTKPSQGSSHLNAYRP
jgi:hypothetical protein